MEQSTQQRTMAATRWLLLLLCIAAAGGMLEARAQPDNKGFISIDCGLSEEMGFVDNTTKLSYAPDAGFVDAGTNHIISPEYVTNVSSSLAKSWYSLRSFTAGTRNCYTLRSLMPGLKYLIRGKFILDLRPLKRTLYPQVTAAQGLVLFNRLNFGLTDKNAIVRYPDDPHDRIWIPFVDTVTWAEISMTSMVQNIDNEDLFEAPTAVLKTAIKPRNTSANLEFTWYPVPTPNDPSPG
ncbi:hypothetical protein VPH35_004171 [Triticum aestivum]